jgi:aspartyl-tRNA(Asn)/glutamyl-tRNA(Gln) amidotransferase subunit C
MTDRLTDEQVRHVAKLSRLRLREEEVHPFAQQLSKVLDYVSKLGELNLDCVEPMTNAMDLTNVLREDVEQPGMPVEQALSNAPEQSPPFFKVPKVLGDGSGA